MLRKYKTTHRTTHLLNLALLILVCVLALTFGVTQEGHTAKHQTPFVPSRPLTNIDLGNKQEPGEDTLNEVLDFSSAFSGNNQQEQILSHTAIRFSLEEYKRLGFSALPVTPSSADPVTRLIDVRPDIALGDKTPIILIHGLHGGESDDINAEFGNLMRYLHLSTNFSTKYKLYLFRYKSDIYHVYDIAASLRNRIDDLVRQNSRLTSKQFVLIAHSMGGLVARSYMNQHNTDFGGQPFQGQRAGLRIQKLITLATPHHGAQLMNGRARGGSDEWQKAYLDLDYTYWKLVHGCRECAFHLDLPNRADLLWDNFTHQWDNNSFYTGAPTEHNPLLPMSDSDHAYDNKIIAYYGVIGSNKKTNSLSKNSAKDLANYIKTRGAWSSHLGANATSVLLQRIADNNFVVSNPLTIFNDGAVHDSSARFDRPDGKNWPAIAARIRCQGYDHEDMKDGKNTPCDDGRPLFKSILFELDPSLSASSLTGFQKGSASLSTVGSGLLSLNSPGNLGVVRFTPGSQGSGEDEDVTVYNLGESPTQVSSISLGGANPDQFQLANIPSLPFTLQAGGAIQITVRFKPNSLGDKSAVINVANDSVNSSAVTTVSGFGLPSDCDVVLSPASRYIPVSGGGGTFTVPPISCSWSAATDDAWIHISVASSTVNYTVDSNATGGLRFGKIDINVSGVIYSFYVVQSGTSSGCGLTLSENQREFPTNGGSNNFTVSTPDNCAWSASSDSAWISVNTSGLRVGTQSLNYAVTPNPNPSIRFGTITVQGQDSTQVFTVSQQSGVSTCAYSLSASEQNFFASGGQNSFTITAGSGCQWIAYSPDSWITITSSNNRIGTSALNYSVIANQSSSARSGSIIVVGNNNVLTFYVRQDGQPVAYPNISLPITNIQMGDALVNSTIYQGVVINNTGQGYLFLGSIYLSSGSSDFDILPYGQNQVIAPGGTTAVTVKLTPSSTGSRSATFTVTSNTPNTPSASFSVFGNGVTQITGGIDFVWANKFTIPSQASVSAVTGVTINNVIYVVGGDDYKYDPTVNTNNWSSIAPQPFAQYGAADVVNGKIYLVGYDPFSGSTRVVIYDPANNSWSTGATMPALRLDIAVAAANGKVYAFGGRSGTGADPATSSVYEYNPSTNAWATKTNMPTARMGAVAITLNGLIYVMGGRSGSQELQVVEVYNPANDTWATRERMPSPRAWASAFIINSKIYVAGGIGNYLGQGGGFTRYDLVEEFDPSKPDTYPFGPPNAWAVRNHLITGRYTCAAGVVNNKAYVVGGSNSSGAGVYTIEEGVLAASPKINLPVASFNCGDVPLGNYCDRRIEVQNQGNAQLTISSWGRSSGSSDFGSFAGGSTVEAGQSISLIVRLTPTSTGTKAATFTINSNDPSTPSLTFSLSANAVTAPLTSGAWQIVNTIQLSNPSNHPSRIVIANGKAYVGRYPSRVSVIDLSSGTTVGDIQFSAYPNSDVQSIVISDNRAYVILGNLSPGEVAVVNTDNNSVLSYVPISGAHAFSLAVTNTKVYVANAGPDTVSVIDRGTNSVINTIPISTGAAWIKIDPNSGKAYVTGKYQGCSSSGSCLSVIDTATDTVVSNISVPTPYSDGDIALSSTRAYLATEASVEVIDLSSNLPVASIPITRYAGSAIAATGEYVIVGSSSADISVISTATNFIVGKLTVNSPNSIAVDPATRLVYVVDYNDSVIKALRFVAPGFSVTTNSQSLAATAGGNTAFTTTISSIDGFSGAVNLSCEGLPTGSTCQFGQNPVTVPANGSASTNLTVAVPSGAIPGPYSLKVVGSGSAPQSAASSSSKAVAASAADTTPLIDFQNVSLTVPSCDYALSSQSISVGADTITGSVDVLGTTGCSWTAVSNAAWISITSSASGSGNGTVRYSVAANTGATPRTGTLTIAGQTLTFNQSAATYTISGRVTDGSGNGIGSVTVSLSGSQTLSLQTDGGGNYSFANLSTGNYTITPSRANYTFNPGSQAFNSLNSNQTANFTGTPVTFSIAGQATIGNVGLGGVTVTLGGSQSQTTTTDAGGTYQFTNVLAGRDYTITPSKTNYTFTPQNRTFSNLSGNQTASFTATINPGVPILVSEEASTRAIALDSVVWLRDPFQLNSPIPWGFDRRTRVMLFAMNFDLLPGENMSVVTADAEDASHRIYPLTVEYVGKVPGFDWLSCVTVRLNDDMGDIGDVLVRITVRGVSSNRVRLGVGHTGGGPPDDFGAVPTPGRQP